MSSSSSRSSPPGGVEAGSTGEQTGHVADDASTPNMASVRPVVKPVYNQDLTALFAGISLSGNDSAGVGDDNADAPKAPEPNQVDQPETVISSGSVTPSCASLPPAYPEMPQCSKRDFPGIDAFVLSNVLSPAETAALRKHTEELAYTFWNLSAPERTDFRNADTVEIESPQLADLIWQRIRHLVTQEIVITPDQDRWEKGFDGTWRAVGVNSHLLFARYLPGGHFSPHTDGYTIIDFNKRSLYTLLVYLNDCQDGGSTRLFRKSDTRDYVVDGEGRYRWREEAYVDKARVVDGTALAFYQDLPHEGEPVGEGCCKYIIRTDILYERTPHICDSPKDREAYELFRKAELMEADGDAIEASKLFRRCVKLSPALADVFGM